MNTTIAELKKIPGVGNAIAEDLIGLGFTSIASLKNQNPEKMYKDLCVLQKTKVDRCMLYVFRCAVYFASNRKHDPKLLLWWNWKEKVTKS